MRFLMKIFESSHLSSYFIQTLTEVEKNEESWFLNGQARVINANRSCSATSTSECNADGFEFLTFGKPVVQGLEHLKCIGVANVKDREHAS